MRVSFLANLSRRLMGELIGYQSLRCLSVVRPQFQTSLKPLGQLNSISYGDSLGPGTKICSNGPGHMATMPIYGKNPLKNLPLQNQKAHDLGTWYVALGMCGLPSLFK